MNFIQLRLGGCALIVLGGAIPSAFGFAEIAQGKLIASASFIATYDTNILSNQSEVTDFIASFSPGLSYTRNVGLITTSVSAGVKSYTFTDNKGYDSIDPSINCNLSMDASEKVSTSISFGYARKTEADNILLDRVESNQLQGSVQASYLFREKIGISTTANYRRTQFITPGLDDVSSYGLGGGLLYYYSPQINASARYSYAPVMAAESSGTANSASSTSYLFALNFNGELATKLSGSTSLGYGFRTLETGGTDAILLLGVDVIWNLLEKSTVSLSASNNFETTERGESARKFDVELGYQQVLTSFLLASASVGYQQSQVDQQPGPIARLDDGYSAGLKLSYSINKYWSASAGVTHRINESNNDLAVFNRTLLSFTLDLTF